MKVARTVVAARGAGQDRVAVSVESRRVVIALADGAGGTSRGELAAQAIVDAAGSGEACELLARLDREIDGQSTAVILEIDGGEIVGASAGDSEAWLVGDGIVDLTENQVRKPLVGGGCVPVPIRATLGAATLVVGSDGLFRYAKRADIARVATGPDLDAAVRALVELVRLPNGTLQDDISIVLVRSSPPAA